MKTNYTSLVALQLAPYRQGKELEQVTPGNSKINAARPRLFGTRRPENRPFQHHYYLQTGIAWQPHLAVKPATPTVDGPTDSDLKYFDIFASIVSLTQEFTPPVKGAPVDGVDQDMEQGAASSEDGLKMPG